MNHEFYPTLKNEANQTWYDHDIDNIMIFLFQTQNADIKSNNYAHILQCFSQLDLSAHYFLFDLIQERLPHRAKMLFAGESYHGKRETILEVMAHIGNS